MASEEPVSIDLIPSRRKPGRIDVRVGRRIAATILPASVTALDLRSGGAWTPELAARIERRVELERAYRAASDALARRPLSERQVRERLERRGFDSLTIAETVAVLIRDGLVDDAQTARQVVDETLARAGAGAALLESKLTAKGIDDETARRTVSEAAPEGAEEAARRHSESLPARLTGTAKARRLYAFLARRGFDEHESAEAVRRVLGIDPDAPDAAE